jgi:hypothetical protein
VVGLDLFFLPATRLREERGGGRARRLSANGRGPDLGVEFGATVGDGFVRHAGRLALRERALGAVAATNPHVGIVVRRNAHTLHLGIKRRYRTTMEGTEHAIRSAVGQLLGVTAPHLIVNGTIRSSDNARADGWSIFDGGASVPGATRTMAQARAIAAADRLFRRDANGW